MNLPSQKLFLIFIPIVVILGLFVMFKSQPKTDNPQPTTEQAGAQPTVVAVQNSIINTVDSDNDGVPDWEETIWGTDPHNPNTFGIPDKIYILQQMQKEQATQSTTITTTDDLSRQLFTKYVALQSSGQLTAESIDAMTKDITSNIDIKPLNTPYTTKDILTFPNTDVEKIKTYATTMVTTINQWQETYKAQFGSSAMVPEDPSFAKNMLATADYYLKLSKVVVGIPVPAGTADAHLAYANALKESAQGLSELGKMDTEPLQALIGVQRHIQAEDDQQTSLTNITLFLNSNGIMGVNLTPL